MGKSKNPKQVCGKYQGPAAANERVYINCSRSLFGKYVKIVKWSSNGRSSLSLGEVFVCGTKGETYMLLYQSPLILTELFQHNLINVSYLTACYLYQVMMTLHFLIDVANHAKSTQKSKITS